MRLPGETSPLTSFPAVDIVTETDQGVEKMVSTRLSSAFPSISFMGEETYKPGMRIGPEPTFVVDPIDGASLFLPLTLHASFSHLISPHVN
jgi:myo-inositol-1(or 4)-monophosphatase